MVAPRRRLVQARRLQRRCPRGRRSSGGRRRPSGRRRWSRRWASAWCWDVSPTMAGVPAGRWAFV
eukprot:11160689-Lingulodinium_polyedra.AAC.1